MEAQSPHTETIAAVATAIGRGGIGVVRVSGIGLAAFAQTLTGSWPEPRQAKLLPFLDASGQLMDRGVLLFFQAPNSYTGEDVLELQAHGSPVVLDVLLRRCLELGARIAAPGEFTKRAFLNGKLDLAAAEAVADLIDAGSAAAARSALRSLSGEFSTEVSALDATLKTLRILAESAIDFPEDDLDVLSDGDLLLRVSELRAQVEALLARARRGSMLRRGLQVVLAGRPNVGKSSLLNCLAGERRAIVTDIPGTTRDALREALEIGGLPLHIIDTAGLRATQDEVEKLGIGRTWEEVGRADVVVLVGDDRFGLAEEEQQIAADFPPGVPVVVVLNKVDLSGHGVGVVQGDLGRIIRLSARTREGVDLLEAELLRIAGFDGYEEDSVLARERHLAALSEVAERLAAAASTAHQLDVLAEELRLCQVALGTIVGEFAADDLLGEIFSRFCVGK